MGYPDTEKVLEATILDSESTFVQSVEYAYDVYNQLVLRTLDDDGQAGVNPPVNTIFSWEGGQIALQFEGGASAVPSHRYLWNPTATDHLFADENALNEVLWTLNDHLGTSRDLVEYDETEEEGAVVNHRFYDSFGRLLSQTDDGYTIAFGFTGVYFEIATGLQNHRNRWLDVGLGRWVSEDPIGFLAGDTNLNAYVGNAPTMYVDPTGLWEEPTMWDAIKGGGVGGFWRWLGGGTPNEGQVHDANRAHELRMQLLGETGGDKSSLGAWKREVGSMPGAALDCAKDTAINVTVTIIPGPVDDAIAKGNEVRKGAQFGKAALLTSA